MKTSENYLSLSPLVLYCHTKSKIKMQLQAVLVKIHDVITKNMTGTVLTFHFMSFNKCFIFET